MRSNYFRVSVTSLCNFKCHFCHNEGQFGDETPQLNAEDIIWTVGIATNLGFSKIKLTGGEPTLRPDLPEIISGIRALGVRDLSMITNGSMLNKQIFRLHQAGLPRLNVSIYTLDADKFESSQGVRRALLERTIAGVDAALSLGYRDMKINYVIESKACIPDLQSILEFTSARNLTVVLLPLLKSGGNCKETIALDELEELVRSLGVVSEEHSVDEAGIERNLLTLKTGARILLRRNELGMLEPFRACQSCEYSPTCQEGIFPIRLSEIGVLSPCLANPALRRNIRAAIRSRDRELVTYTIKKLGVD